MGGMGVRDEGKGARSQEEGESWRRGGVGKSRKTNLRGKGSEEAGGRGVWEEKLRRCEDGGEGKQMREKIIRKASEGPRKGREKSNIEDRRL